VLDRFIAIIDFHVGPHRQGTISHPGEIVITSRGGMVRGSHYGTTVLDIELVVILGVHALDPLIVKSHTSRLPVEVLTDGAVCLIETPRIVSSRGGFSHIQERIRGGRGRLPAASFRFTTLLVDTRVSTIYSLIKAHVAGLITSHSH
jgi:hypothetical protein